MLDVRLNSLPFLVFVLIFFFFTSKQKNHVDQVMLMNQEILETNRQTVKILEEIKTILQNGKA